MSGASEQARQLTPSVKRRWRAIPCSDTLSERIVLLGNRLLNVVEYRFVLVPPLLLLVVFERRIASSACALAMRERPQVAESDAPATKTSPIPVDRWPRNKFLRSGFGSSIRFLFRLSSSSFSPT